MMITSVDENGYIFAKFEVTSEDIKRRAESDDKIVHGHDEVVRFIEALGALENRGDGIDKVERLFNEILARGVEHGIALAREKMLAVLP